MTKQETDKTKEQIEKSINQNEDVQSLLKARKIGGWSAVVTRVTPPTLADEMENKVFIDLLHAESKKDLKVLLKHEEIEEVLYVFRGSPLDFKESRQINF